jgi:TatA/E family protein of Tat protein translocase
MEIVLVLVIALLVFGPNRLPQAGRTLGQAVREFRKATETARSELGLDEVTRGIDDLKSSMSVDLNSATAPSPRQDVAAASAATVMAPAPDKPVPVASVGNDTIPAQATASAPDAEPASGEPVAANAVSGDITATGAAAGRDDITATGAAAGRDDA